MATVPGAMLPFHNYHIRPGTLPSTPTRSRRPASLVLLSPRVCRCPARERGCCSLAPGHASRRGLAKLDAARPLTSTPIPHPITPRLTSHQNAGRAARRSDLFQYRRAMRHRCQQPRGLRSPLGLKQWPAHVGIHVPAGTCVRFCGQSPPRIYRNSETLERCTARAAHAKLWVPTGAPVG